MSRFRKLGCWFRSMFTSPAFCLFDDTCFEGSTFSCDVLRNAPQGFTAATVHPHKATPLKGCDSYQPNVCRESCRPCRWAVRLRGGVGPGFHGKYFADDFIDLYSVSVIVVKCAISCYMGLRYNTTLVISFMNVMPVLWHVPVCVHVCVTCGVGRM